MKTYGLEEAAAFLHVSKDSMRDMADSGKVPAAKIGPTSGYRWVFTDEGLEEYLRDEIRKQTAGRRGAKPGDNPPVPTGYDRTATSRRQPRTPPVLTGAGERVFSGAGQASP